MEKTINRALWRTAPVLAFVAICATFSACSIWQDEETTIQPLPEVTTPIHTEPWEQPPDIDPQPIDL